MTTKDNFELTKDKQKFYLNNVSHNSQYSNFNLNRNHKSAEISPVQSHSKPYKDKTSGKPINAVP